MKFLQIMLCSLTAAVAFSLGAVPPGDFQNGKEGWAGTGTVQDGVLTVVDSSATSGVYAIRPVYRLIPVRIIALVCFVVQKA